MSFSVCNKGPREYIKGLVPFHRSILGGRVIFIKSNTYSYEEVIFFKKKSWEIIKNTAIFFTSISIHPCLRFSFLCRVSYMEMKMQMGNENECFVFILISS